MCGFGVAAPVCVKGVPLGLCGRSALERRLVLSAGRASNGSRIRQINLRHEIFDPSLLGRVRPMGAGHHGSNFSDAHCDGPLSLTAGTTRKLTTTR
jgi:hypothetical protein